MNAARLVAWIVLPAVGLLIVGALAVALVKALLNLVFYLLVGALVVGGGVYLYRRARRAVDPAGRTRRRIEAVNRTRRLRNR